MTLLATAALLFGVGAAYLYLLGTAVSVVALPRRWLPWPPGSAPSWAGRRWSRWATRSTPSSRSRVALLERSGWVLV